MNDVDAIQPPRDASMRPSSAAAVCAVVACIALVPFLYVGSFAYLTADARNRWGVMDSLDQGSVDFLTDFYWPLIWTCELVIQLAR